LALVATGCSDEESEEAVGDPAEPARVEIAVDPAALDTEDAPRIGVVLTLDSAPGQGADRRFGAAGAQVAAYRLDLGGSDVELEVVDDEGTDEGARTAMKGLVEAGVSGIVVASAGDHLDAALAETSDAGVPVLLPYYEPASTPDGVWVTGPDRASVDSQLLEALGEDGRDRPFVVTGDGVALDGVGSADSEALTGANTAAVVRRVLAAAEAGDVDSVVLGAAPGTLADLVGRLLGRGLDLPIHLSPEAQSPVFARQLAEDTGTLPGGLISVGADAGDTSTLAIGETGDRAAAFFAALRLAHGDDGLTDLLGSGSFAEVAADADLASHDAVVALVRAVEAAGSTAPGEVREALDDLSVDGGDGLAGPALDFSAAQALSREAVTTLVATAQDPGVRPGAQEGGAARFYWFASDAAADTTTSG